MTTQQQIEQEAREFAYNLIGPYPEKDSPDLIMHAYISGAMRKAWIEIEKLPNNHTGELIILTNTGKVRVVERDIDNIYWFNGVEYFPTHFMLLPDPPKIK